MQEHPGLGIPLERAIDNVRPLAETIWGNLAALSGEGGQVRILLTSTEAQSGNTLITAATALGLARNTRRAVTVVEANLARPSMARMLGVEGNPGLSELLLGSVPPERCRVQVPSCPELTVLAGGAARHVIPGEFAADNARALLANIGREERYLLFDAPPILEHSETRALLPHVDGVVLVVRARSSRKTSAREVLELLENLKVEVFGSVLNRFRSDLPFGEGRP